MNEVIFIYDKSNLGNVIERPVLSVEDFNSDKKKYFPDFNDEKYFASEVKIQNSILDAGNVREMNDKELIESGLKKLEDGQYLDSEEIKTVEKPNSYSKWDKDSHTWIGDKVEKLQYFKDLRYTKQQEYIKYKKELEEKEDEKAEFESLGFDTKETEERIIEIKAEMDLLKTEISKLSKEITSLTKK